MIYPVASSAPAPSGAITQAGGTLGKDEFLQLLVTQLRYQDPLNPMKADDMAAQLAQFSNVEQLIEANRHLSQQASYFEALTHGFNTNAAMSVLGKTVLAHSNRVQLPEKDAQDVTVTLAVADHPGTARAKLRILDANGVEVGSRDLGVVTAGRQEIKLGKAANGLAAGEYTIKVEVTDGSGNTIAADVYQALTITGVRYSPLGPVLMAEDTEIALDAIREVYTQS